VAVGKNVDVVKLQQEAHLMGELVGLGLRGAGKSKINIDLVPSSVAQSRAAERRKPFLIAAAALVLAGSAAFAGLQAAAASKAADAAKRMSDAKENFGPLRDQITAVLKKEGALRKIAEGYTQAESDRAFWIDAVGELRGAMASDVVWLTELVPLGGYRPLPPAPSKDPKAPAPPKDAGAGKELVKADFATAPYGTSPLVEVRVEQPAPVKGKKTDAAPVSEALTANAIRVRGLWRENPSGPNVVSQLLKRLKENPAHFKFTATGPDGKEVNLTDEQIIKKLTVAPEGGEFALPFELVLPLSREVTIK
jgi:hypothetical protein